MLAICADGLVADVEETALRRLLKAIGHDGDWKTVEQTVMALNRSFLANPESAGQRAESLARTFETNEEKKLAREILDDIFSAAPAAQTPAT